MEDEALDELRRVSRAIFGQQSRVEVMAAIARSPDGIVCLTDVAAAAGLGVNRAQKPFASLVEAGLLTPLPGNDRRKHYLRTDSLGWPWADELMTRTASSAANHTPRH